MKNARPWLFNKQLNTFVFEVSWGGALSPLPSEPVLSQGHPFPADDDSLDLSCSLVDLINLGVPHQLLNRVLSVEAIASKHLDSISGGLLRKKTLKGLLQI